MSGFDPAWLDLRESADKRARAASLLEQLSGRFASRESVRVADLGCGTGSLLRALAPLLPDHQHWLLIDGDPAVLAAAVPRLTAWAEAAEPSQNGLRLNRLGKQIEVTFRQVDLATDPLPVTPGEADLIGASALFDLVSAAWLERFTDRLKAYGAPLYAALSYDGQMHWHPPHPDDRRAETLFNAHQTRDKGTGAALGPAGASRLGHMLTRHGFQVTLADSPWHLGLPDAALTSATVGGVADALQEIEQADWIQGWRNHPRTAATIGHQDLLAIP
jgi:SAM-dependent methyltransferase